MFLSAGWWGGGAVTHGIFTEPGRGLEPESWAWYLELHSKEMDKDPADSCGAALSQGGMGGVGGGDLLGEERWEKKKYLLLKFNTKPKRGKGK